MPRNQGDLLSEHGPGTRRALEALYLLSRSMRRPQYRLQDAEPGPTSAPLQRRRKASRWRAVLSFFAGLGLGGLITGALSAATSGECLAADATVSSGRAHLVLGGDDGSLRLVHDRTRSVIAGWALPAASVTARASSGGCIMLRVAAGGSLQLSVTTSGHWYGGPSTARAFWPINHNRIELQPWRSNDMLADREKLGSVLEGMWLTSTGASVRLHEDAVALNFSLNVPCNGEEAAAEAKLCLAPTSSAPLLVELCAAADVRAAQLSLLSLLPRPTQPQRPSIELIRAPVWSTWARFKMDVDQQKTEARPAPPRDAPPHHALQRRATPCHAHPRPTTRFILGHCVPSRTSSDRFISCAPSAPGSRGGGEVVRLPSLAPRA